MMRSLRKTIAATALLLGVALILTGCTGPRVGIGLPEAVVYQNTITPLTMKRNRKNPGQPVTIPDNLNYGDSTSYMLDFSIPGVISVPGVDLSIGWGRMDLETAMSEGNLKEVTYADGQVIKILRVFTMARIKAYGPPAGEDQDGAGR